MAHIEHDSPDDPRPPLLLAARQPLHLAVLAVAIAAGLTVALWLLPLGVLVYALVVLLASRDPALSRAARQSALRSGSVDPTLRGVSARIEQTALDVERAVDRSPETLRPLFERIREQTTSLVAASRDLARKRQAIEQYLARADVPSIQAEIDQLDARLGRIDDPDTRQHTEQTRRALAERQKNTRALATHRDRIDAQLDNIRANLDNVLAEVVRLGATDAAHADSASGRVAHQLADLESDVGAFRQVLDSALAESEAPA